MVASWVRSAHASRAAPRARGRLKQTRRHGRLVVAVRFQIDAHAAHAGVMHVAQHSVARRVVDHGDAAPARAKATQRIDGHRIVRPIGARMYDDDAIEMERGLEGEQVLDARIAGRVAALFGIGKLVGRAEHVGVAVAGAHRHVEGDRRVRDAEDGGVCAHDTAISATCFACAVAAPSRKPRSVPVET